jgi:hypothetical protein
MRFLYQEKKLHQRVVVLDYYVLFITYFVVVAVAKKLCKLQGCVLFNVFKNGQVLKDTILIF